MTPSPKRFFLTGGAGFIGSHLARALGTDVAERIWVFDNLHPQVHGANALPPALPDHVIFVKGDVRDHSALRDCILEADPDIVVHLASETGTSQSGEEVARYCEVNVMGTANLIEVIRLAAPRVRRIVLPSSRAIYGEGPYRRPNGAIIIPPPRRIADLEIGQFQPPGPNGEDIEAVPMHEDTPPAPCSVYGSTKLMQEFLLCQAFPRNWEPVILRLQNVYGPGQSLTNPYTGVLSIFTQQISEGRSLDIYEDGAITRDFVYIDDVVDALTRACHAERVSGEIINIGTGRGVTILEVARILLQIMGKPEDRLDVTGHFRAGDIRHAVADVNHAKRCLRWQPTTQIETGLTRLSEWVRDPKPPR